MKQEQVLPKPAVAPAAPLASWIWPPLVLATAVIGGLASTEAAAVYEGLERPAWAPHPAVFGPVWGLLYGLMAIAATWVASGKDSELAAARRVGLTLFGLALIPNALWSWCFFAWQRADWAMGCMLLLLVLLGAAVSYFGRVQRGAAWLMVPLLAWVSFAAVLNADLLLRNGPLL
jgi:tryptophan-rich sensory protein